jgi:hypothetical protein
MSWRTHRPTRAAAEKPYLRQRRLTEAEQRKRDASREAQRTGVDAETLVESMGAEYKDAVLRKRHEPYRRIGGAGKGGVFKAVNTGSSGPDFEIWLKDGRAGFIEVKSRKGSRVPLAAVGDAQALALQRCVEWGHLSFVLVRLDHEWFLVHYSAWTHHKKRSLNRTDLSVQGVQCAVDQLGRPDFLSVLSQAERAAAVYIQSLPDRGDDEGESDAP